MQGSDATHVGGDSAATMNRGAFTIDFDIGFDKGSSTTLLAPEKTCASDSKHVENSKGKSKLPWYKRGVVENIKTVASKLSRLSR